MADVEKLEFGLVVGLRHRPARPNYRRRLLVNIDPSGLDGLAHRIRSALAQDIVYVYGLPSRTFVNVNIVHPERRHVETPSPLIHDLQRDLGRPSVRRGDGLRDWIFRVKDDKLVER